MTEVGLERAKSEQRCDVIVIGGSATRLGPAVDRAGRRNPTLLLKAHDFAKGLSSRSTKLVQRRRARLGAGRSSAGVRSAARAGSIARQCIISGVSAAVCGVGLHLAVQAVLRARSRVYSLLAGSLGIDYSRSVGAKEALRLTPTLEPEGLTGGVVLEKSKRGSP